MVPRVGFEPTAYRLRSGCSTAELPGRRDRLVSSLFECRRQAVWRDGRQLRRGRGKLGRSTGFGRNRQIAAGVRPGECTPREGIEGAAMGTQRAPIEALSAAARADIARIRYSTDGAVEPLARRSEVAVLGLLEPRHQQAQARSYAGGLRVFEMTAGLAPELGIKRRFGQHKAAFARRRVLGGEPREGFDPGERQFAFVDRSINPCEIGMGSGTPGAFDSLRSASDPPLPEQQSRMMRSRRGKVVGQRLGFGRQGYCTT